MDMFLSGFGTELLFASFVMAAMAGVIKGVVGFGMPTVLISGLSTFLSPEWALAGLILPTVMSNGLQALRQGLRAAFNSVRHYRIFLIVGGLCLVISAQFVRALPENAFLLSRKISWQWIEKSANRFLTPSRVAPPPKGGG